MASEELLSIVTGLKSQGVMAFPEAASEEQLSTFEKVNSFNLPIQFREWLLFTDGGECFLPAGVQLYGVAHKPVIDVNEDDRPSEDYVVIGALATGDPILWKKETSEISIYNHEANRIESDEIYADFFSFLIDLPAILGLGG